MVEAAGVDDARATKSPRGAASPARASDEVASTPPRAARRRLHQPRAKRAASEASGRLVEAAGVEGTKVGAKFRGEGTSAEFSTTNPAADVPSEGSSVTEWSHGPSKSS